MAEKSGFTAEEAAKELSRRKNANANTKKSVPRSGPDRCVHCGQAV
ncbi:hypothetical protein ACWGTI_26840 [Mesorhizobium sp. ArgA1]